MAGNRAVAALLAPTPSDSAPRVQRNIGFEFENPQIHIRKVAGAKDTAEAGRAGKLTDEAWPPKAPNPLPPKHPAMTLGEGPATLEADDTLGKGEEDVEIVVPRLKPHDRGFSVTEEGHAAMVAALGMAAKFAISAGGAGVKHAGEVREARARANSELQARREKWAERYSASNLLKSKDLGKEATREKQELGPVHDYKKVMKEVKQHLKAQGKRKSAPLPPPTDLPQKMNRIRADLVQRGLIEPEPRARLATYRDLTAVSEFWSAGDDLVLGEAGHAGGVWAVHVTMGIPLTALDTRLKSGIWTGSEALAHLVDKEIPQGRELAGFIRLVASYLWGAESWKMQRSNNPKQMVDLLARNSFAAMFRMIPLATRIAIAKQPGIWLAAWAAESVDLSAPLLAKPEIGFETSYSRKEWLKGMIGTVSGEEHHEGFDLVAMDKSLDSMGKWTQFDTGKDGGPIPILEDRLQENWAPGDWINRGRDHFEKTRTLLEG